MRVTHVELRDFRNYKELTLELGAGPTLIVGSNGQGKTNLVEALGFLSKIILHYQNFFNILNFWTLQLMHPSTKK